MSDIVQGHKVTNWSPVTLAARTTSMEKGICRLCGMILFRRQGKTNALAWDNTTGHYKPAPLCSRAGVVTRDNQ